jgi:glycosyltransferase involved in cell wall biosynthesis
MNTAKHHFPAADIPATSGITFIAVDVRAGISPVGALRNLMGKKPYHVDRFASKRFHEKILQLDAQEHFDVIQAEGLYLVQYLQNLGPDCRASRMYRSHNLEFEIWDNVAEHQFNRFKKWYLKLQAKRLKEYELEALSNCVDGIIPISTVDTGYYKTKVARIACMHAPTGMEIMGQRPGAAWGKDIYCIGGLDWLPNIEGLYWFFEAVWPRIREMLPEAKMHLAGRNAPKHFAESLPEGVTFYGEVPDAQAFAADKAVCVVPLLSGSGMKIKIAEAMAVGKVVVTTYKGAEGMPEGMDLHLYVADDPIEFAQLVVALLLSPESTHDKGIDAQGYMVRNLSNTAIAERLTHFYQTLSPI